MSRKYVKAKVDWHKRPKGSRALPNQSMSVKDILDRWMKGIPPDVKTRDQVYIPGERDLEKLAQLPFDEKAEYARTLREQNDAVVENAKRATKERKEREEQVRAEKQQRRESGEDGSGLDNLDNTRPVDTKQKTK